MILVNTDFITGKELETITLVKANNAVEATRYVGEYAEDAYVFKRGTEDGRN
jgi:hypothetical protein